MPDDTAHKAMSAAQSANDRLDGHEKLCTERWTEAKKMLSELFRRWWWLLTVMLAGQGTIIVMLWQSRHAVGFDW